jgi:ketosteroid isomerase-like protein
MKTLRKLCWIGSSAIFLSGIALSQTTTPEAQTAVVVKLHTHFSTQKKDETAAGLFVGKDQQYAYFITARHAIADEVDNQEVLAQSTKLWFNGSPQPLDASVVEHTDANLDLGVVSLPLANLPPNLPQIVRKDAAVNVSVRIVGHPAAGDWSVWQGTIQNENAPNGDIYHFITTTNPSLAHGYSGGPVFDPDGNFLGMHTATVASYGIAAKGALIVAQLKAWPVPANNLTDVRPESDIEAIKRVLHQYEEAYNQRDANALWKLWPDAPAKARHPIEISFPTARSISMKLQYSDSAIKIEGTTATVTGQFTQVFVPKSGDSHTRDGAIIFKMKKKDGVWMIGEIQ